MFKLAWRFVFNIYIVNKVSGRVNKSWYIILSAESVARVWFRRDSFVLIYIHRPSWLGARAGPVSTVKILGPHILKFGIVLSSFTLRLSEERQYICLIFCKISNLHTM
jgi:hypothetical protein